MNTKIKKKVLLFASVIVFAFVFGILGGLLGGYLVPSVRDIVEVGKKEVTLKESSATIDVAKKVSPSVVSITAERRFQDFFGRIQQAESNGTGFIVSSDGLIITNKHVASDTSLQYLVFTHDGGEYQARVVAKDPHFDIAFLKIDAENLTVAELGDSDALEIGQTVIAIGNALGQFDNTVTKGVVSAVGRAIAAGDGLGRSQELLENMIQTDAAINPGNSGGPLVNISGQVIGINTAVAGGAEGLGFAIPINIVKTAIESVKKTGEIVRPMIGIRYINITKDFASRNNLKVEYGALIYAQEGERAIVPGSPAEKAGLKEGDIIKKINDDEIRDGQSLITLLYKHNPGDEVTLTFMREDREMTAKVRLAEAR